MIKIINSNLVHVFAILVFAITTIVYCWPFTEGEKIAAGDYQQFLGMSKEIVDYRSETGEEALWTNSIFGGMPAYQISVHYTNNILVHLDKFFQLYLPRPIGVIFLYFIGFYILLLMLRVNPHISILGALAFGLSSYFFIILEAGHNTKAHAIAYIAPSIASMIYCFRKNDKTIWHKIIGFFLTFLFVGLHLRANHLQITYYLLFILFFFWSYYLINYLSSRDYSRFIKNTLIFTLGSLMAIAINLGNIWSTYEYSKYTIRGDAVSEDEKSGLDTDYATDWSYGKMETFNLLYPNFMGGASVPFSQESNLFSAISKDLTKQYISQYPNPEYRSQIKEQVKKKDAPERFKYFRSYFGAQPMTSGPVYIGAIVWLLFFIGLFTLKKPIKWMLLGLVAISFLLAWGKHASIHAIWLYDLLLIIIDYLNLSVVLNKDLFSFSLSNFLLEYFPLYNKFRTPSMILVIAQFAIPFFGFLGLHKFIYGDLSSSKQKTILFGSVGFFIFLAACFLLFKHSLIDFLSSDENLIQQMGFVDTISVQNALVQDRVSLFIADILRSTFFICVASVIIYLAISFKSKDKFLTQKLKVSCLYGLLILVLFDMWNINKRYLNAEDFKPIIEVEKAYDRTLGYTKVDKVLGQDSTVFRVFDKVQFTNTSTSSAGHHSLGGYHAAKLGHYQKLIEEYIHPNENTNVINMLNAKYIIDPNIFDEKLSRDTKKIQFDPQLNQDALGNTWLVDDIMWVGNEEVALFALGGNYFNPNKKAIVDTTYKKYVNSLKLSQGDSIKLISYSPNRLVYSSTSKDTVLAVFSEIFYPKGWQAYINGEKAMHFPVNYALRGMVLPRGAHEVVFEFKPKSFHISSKVSFASSFLLVITALMTVVGLFRIKR